MLNTGKIIQIIGSVVDVRIVEKPVLPFIFNAFEVIKPCLILECQ